MLVWIQNPFDHLPEEGFRKQRYRLMAEAFARAGHRVVYFTSDFSHARKARRVRADGTALTALGCEGLEYCLVKTRPYARNVSLARVLSHRAYAREWERVAEEEQTATGRPALIVSSIPTISGAEAALRLGRRFGAKVVIDVQDAWPETFERLAATGLASGLARELLAPLRARARRVYREAGLVTGVCDRYRELVGRDDYYRAYLGIELGGATRKGFRVYRGSGFRLVYAGGSGRSYDLAALVRRVEGDSSLTLDLATNARLATDCPRIRQHGYLASDALRDLFARCDTGVIPMRDDSWVGVPNKFFDYAAAGLRIETSLGGECAALADRWNCGELPWSELDATKIYDDYVRKVTQ